MPTDTLDRLCGLLPGEVGAQLASLRDTVREVRLRAGRPLQVVTGDKEALLGSPVSQECVRKMLASLMDYSLYAREDELRQGYFTLQDGSRVGVCGKMTVQADAVAGMVHVSSVCIRIAREVKGCGEALMPYALDAAGPKSLLLISPPGLGKTTCLRDLSRLISNAGWCVGIADERHEIAACAQGVPTVDVGPRTDVMDGCPKWIAIGQMIRSMAPSVIVTDEIGSPKDAQALEDAARCGVSVIASAHAAGFEALEMRDSLARILHSGVFTTVVLLGETPGNIMEARAFAGSVRGGIAWKSA